MCPVKLQSLSPCSWKPVLSGLVFSWIFLAQDTTFKRVMFKVRDILDLILLQRTQCQFICEYQLMLA